MLVLLPLLPCFPSAGGGGGGCPWLPNVECSRWRCCCARPPARPPARRAWFDVDTFAAALASEGLSAVAGKAAAPAEVSIKDYDSQSKVNALVNYLKKHKKHQHIRWGG